MVDKNLKDPFCIVRIPKDKRDPSLPQKYKISIKGAPFKIY